MTEIQSPVSNGLPYIPDDLTLPQFMLDYQHLARPVRKDGIPWLIEDSTGRRIGFEEVKIDGIVETLFYTHTILSAESTHFWSCERAKLQI